MLERRAGHRYLLTRPEVDPDKIGVTGISGGGAATFWIAAADERVKVAVPVSGMSDLESYVKNKVINGHCDCMFLYNTYQWDWTTIAALVAPRPLLFANSDNDPIFPMDGNRRIIAKLRQCYTMHGKGDLVDEYVSKGGHAYRPDLRIAAFRFLNKHLKGDTTSPVEDSAKYKELPGKDLRVFPTDADVPKDALNARIDETFVPRAKVTLPEKGKFAEWKAELWSKVKQRAFRAFPTKFPDQGLYGGGVRVSADSEGEVTFYSRPKPILPKKLNLKQFIKKDDILVSIVPRIFNPPDQGPFELDWTTKSPPNYVERSLVLLGHTVDERKLFYLIGTLQAIPKTIQPNLKRDRTLIGIGEEGVTAAYAALFQPSFKEVVLINPPKSHKDGPHFLGVLRVLDIPEALGLLAPTPLTIIGGSDPAFDRTAEIYRLAGAADKLTRK